MTIHDEVETAAPVRDPLLVATRLRTPQRVDIERHFAPSDPPAGGDLARHPRIARLLKSRRFQFMLILPNQIIFWLVIFIGLFGTLDPNLNFGTAITWYIWFALVFVMMVVAGRAWCVMCPFGGAGEWVQRRTFWGRTQRALGLGIKLPEPIARYGFLLSVGTFLLLTWLEEFFGIATPGTPSLTSYMVIGIVVSALIFFLVFERRTFCRYICPLSCVVGTFGAMGSVAGFRTRDREVCLTCETKDCMRGGEDGYGCPWYTWPGSADSNLNCGLCSECFKACPSDNIGLFVQKPLTSVVAPTRRRADVAWTVAILWGLVLYQQVNALPGYTTIDDWLNTATHLPHYPNPVAYLGLIALFSALMAGIAWGFVRLFARSDLVIFGGGRSFLDRTSTFRAYFLPLMYGIIPVVGADYLARQFPKFFQHAPAIVPAVGHLFGAGSKSSPLYGTAILPDPTIIRVQVAMMGLGTLAAVWTSVRIARRELVPISGHARSVQIAAASLAVACGVATGWLYVLMNAAA
jgi:NosR/NirI family nitrous oxide reductase transcriptional regulator